MTSLIGSVANILKIASTVAVLSYAASGIAIAQQSTSLVDKLVDKAVSVADLEKTLEIPPLKCNQSEMDFDCVTTYIDNVKGKLPDFVEKNLSTIKEKLDAAENAEKDWEELIQTAQGVAEMAREGGDFSKEIDRIGRLIQENRDEVINNEDTADLAPLFDAEFSRWERVRSQLLDVRTQAQDVADLLGKGRARGVALMKLKRIREAIDAADESVQGMSKIVTALQSIADETTRPTDELLGTD